MDKNYISDYHKGTGYNAADTANGLIKGGGNNGYDKSEDGTLTSIYYDFGVVIVGCGVFEIVDSSQELEKRISKLEEGLKEVRNGIHCHNQDWARGTINKVLK